MKESKRYQNLKTVEIDHPLYEGFYVDIVFDTVEECYYLWLGHNNYGIKDMIIGLFKHSTCFGQPITETLESVLDCVQYQAEDSIPLYVESRESEDGHDWRYYADTVDRNMLSLASDLYDFYEEYDPYSGAYSSKTEGITDTIKMLKDCPKSIADSLTDIAEILEDEGDWNDMLATSKSLIDRVNAIAG